jgi:DNA polymerase III epsilon subunit-like protein
VSSYPIEVGLAIARPGLPIETWSTLIRPHRAWLSRAEWDRRAAQVHGITLAELRDGRSPAEVVALLDQKIAPFGQVWVGNT